jgi:hypothetical protein
MAAKTIIGKKIILSGVTSKAGIRLAVKRVGRFKTLETWR